MVLATGAVGRTASVKGEAEFLGRGVSYCATCDGAFYRSQEAVMLDSGQSTSLIYQGKSLMGFEPRPVPHVVALTAPKECLAAQ